MVANEHRWRHLGIDVGVIKSEQNRVGDNAEHGQQIEEWIDSNGACQTTDTCPRQRTFPAE